MNKIPFSLYDFFGYLAAGFVWLLGLNFFFELDIIDLEYAGWDVWLFTVIGAYTVGHVNSHLASWLIEKKIIGALGYPSINLFVEPEKPFKLFKEFRRILPSPLRENILSNYEKMCGSSEPGESMFLRCFHFVKEKCPVTESRLHSFISLYGFSRNMSFALFFIGIMFVFKAFVIKDEVYLSIGTISFLLSIILFFRALKFFRHYSVEVYATFGIVSGD